MPAPRRPAPRKTAAKKVEKRIVERENLNLRRALKEQRTGLVAVTRAILEVCPEQASSILRYLEGMARNAETNRQPAQTCDMIRFGHELLSRALEQQQGRPQGLFDPDVGHVSPGKVAELTEPPGPQQIGFGFTERSPLSDVKERDQERSAGEAAIRATLVRCFMECGPLTDGQLEVEYRKRATPVKLGTVKAQRKELTRLGRLVKNDEPQGGEATWRLLEQVAA